MEQYLQLLREIKERGTYKPPAREGMPGTLSLFGYQFRHNLADGFPLLTTKKLSFKNIVTELLWFLRGDTNIKYLVDNGCNIWNEDAYNYYKKIGRKHNLSEGSDSTFEQFISDIKSGDTISLIPDYELGDCGKQYGWLWRNWAVNDGSNGFDIEIVDQLKELINGLKANPMGRRHIITAWNPATLDDMALNACHITVQFNCRPVSFSEIVKLLSKENIPLYQEVLNQINKEWQESDYPKYYLDCQIYQRSGDVFLGVPYNIASYALLTEIFCRLCNMIPGHFIHSFGDVHIYNDHINAVNEQLTRIPGKLPKLKFNNDSYKADTDWTKMTIDAFLDELYPEDFQIIDYNPQPSIKAKLSTGLQ